MSVLRAVAVLWTAALRPARTPLRRSTAAYTASMPTTAGEIYAGAPSGLFGARPDAYLALEIPVADDLSVAATKDELRGEADHARVRRPELRAEVRDQKGNRVYIQSGN